VTNHEIMKFRQKSPTQIMKVADTNHLHMSRCLRQVRDKPVWVALTEFSLLQYTGKVGDKAHRHKSRKSATRIMAKIRTIKQRFSFFRDMVYNDW